MLQVRGQNIEGTQTHKMSKIAKVVIVEIPLDLMQGLFLFLEETIHLRTVNRLFADSVPCVVKMSSPKRWPARFPTQVTSLSCMFKKPARMPLKFYPMVADCSHLQVLRLHNVSVTSFDFLQGLALKELYVIECKGEGVIHGEHLDVLEMFEMKNMKLNTPNLNDLLLQECRNIEIPTSITRLAHTCNSVPLNLVNFMDFDCITDLNISGQSVSSFQGLKKLPLKKLCLTSCIWDGHVEPWPLSGDLIPECTYLSMRHTSIYLVGVFPKLTSLDMQECPENVKFPLKAPNLTSLNVSDTNLPQDFVDCLQELALEELNASYCAGDGDDGAALDFSRLKPLKYLSIPETYIDGDAPSYGFPEVVCVRFSHEDIENVACFNGLAPETKVLLLDFDTMDDFQETGMNGEWEKLADATVAELKEAAEHDEDDEE
jgi:hypothetical protein